MSKWTPPEAAYKYLPTIYAAETAHRLPTGLLVRVLHQESAYRADIIEGDTRSPVGAIGIAQFMPATAQGRGVDPLDPIDSIWGAADYLEDLYTAFGSWPEALGAYNWGWGRVKRKGLLKAPAETIDYITKICRDVDGL